MMHRDRAWRRKVTRLSTIHSDQVGGIVGAPTQIKGGKIADRQHPHGKLTQTQAMRLNGQLNTDLREAWAPEYTLPMERPPNQAP